MFIVLELLNESFLTSFFYFNWLFSLIDSFERYQIIAFRQGGLTIKKIPLSWPPRSPNLSPTEHI